ncbi:MAG: NOL1/NOP2/sun family putative RNA methylase [Candidatus Woesearchaeota archaeon]
MAKKIPKEDIEIKENFKERFKNLLGDRYDKFIDYSLRFLKRSIRVNTLKISVNDLKKRITKKGYSLKSIPWCDEGFWIEHKEEDRYDFGNMIEHKLGYIYIQEAASMIPPIVLNPKPGDVVIDMAAAPGSKSTQIATYMENKGVLVSNDPNFKRLKALGLNLQRCGVLNSVITSQDARYIKGRFDKILLDAPCTGSGTIRKSLSTLKKWNEGGINRLSKLQKSLILTAYDNLNEGGTLVYSTCSLEPEENEEVINFLLMKRENVKVCNIDLNIKKSEPILNFNGKNYDSSISKTMRLYPQDNDTEGFFIAKIKKKN